MVAFGDVEEYNQRLSLKVKGVSYCDIPEKKEEQVKQKFENENYVYIKPEPYVSMMQSNLFDIQANNTLEVLKNNDFVVFDLETTGLDASSCEIIEIGACKVHDGKITETFSCLIKPKEIPIINIPITIKMNVSTLGSIDVLINIRRARPIAINKNMQTTRRIVFFFETSNLLILPIEILHIKN